MAAAVEQFVFPSSGQTVRTVVIDGEPWFVGGDVCAVLGITETHRALAALDEDEKGRHSVTTPGGPQQTSIISESGLYSMVLRSRKPEARAFRKWVTAEVIPSIRLAGRYEVAERFQVPQTLPEALRAYADEVEAHQQTRAELEAAKPAAEAWTTLASASGDFAVADAAKILSRDEHIQLGRDRLFTLLGQYGWTFRQRGDGRWRVRQTAVDAGWMSEIPASHFHPRTGELVLDAPQVRITAKGLQALHARLGGAARPAIEAHELPGP